MLPKNEEDFGTIIAKGEDRLITLRKDVVYVILQDQAKGITLGKLIDINNIKESWKPGNETAAVLLYMLARGENDPVLLSDFLKLTGNVSDVLNFLNELDRLKVLQVNNKTGSGGQDLDPKKLFPKNWEKPTLITGTAPNVKPKSVYSSGWGPVTYTR